MIVTFTLQTVPSKQDASDSVKPRNTGLQRKYGKWEKRGDIKTLQYSGKENPKQTFVPVWHNSGIKPHAMFRCTHTSQEVPEYPQGHSHCSTSGEISELVELGSATAMCTVLNLWIQNKQGHGFRGLSTFGLFEEFWVSGLYLQLPKNASHDF